jgi:hypothetical protein
MDEEMETNALCDMKFADRVAASQIGDSFESYGCRVNDLSIDDLFGQYEKAGFLYPAKMKRLAPFLPLVKDNWRKARRAGELIQWVATFDNPAAGEWSSISSWLSTNTGWVTQHLVTIGSPLASRAVMLAGAAVRLTDGGGGSHQNWFRRGNRYANKIFGSSAGALGEEHGWIGDYGYYFLAQGQLRTPSDDLFISDAGHADTEELKNFIACARSAVFGEAEELFDEDLNLDAVDQLYQRVGLRRYRRVKLVRDRRSSRLIGAAFAYRGPLGMNFSFLENRCDLLLDPALSQDLAVSVCNALCFGVSDTYRDFEPNVMPVLVDTRQSAPLVSMGAEHIRDYAQSIWLNTGLEKWYRHTERFYEGLVRTGRRRGLGIQHPQPQISVG